LARPHPRRLFSSWTTSTQHEGYGEIRGGRLTGPEVIEAPAHANERIHGGSQSPSRNCRCLGHPPSHHRSQRVRGARVALPGRVPDPERECAKELHTTAPCSLSHFRSVSGDSSMQAPSAAMVTGGGRSQGPTYMHLGKALDRVRSPGSQDFLLLRSDTPVRTLR
jgi:hypothetical protein